MTRRTLYNVKNDGEVPTSGIYVKNNEEANLSKNSKIDYHQDAERKTIELLTVFNLKKNTETSTAIDLVGNYRDTTFYIEVERDYATKRWTTTTNFPYPLINIPVEKGRYFKEYGNRSFYLKYNQHMKEIFIISGEDIVKYTKQQNLNANHSGYRAKRTFLRIEKEHAQFANINDVETMIKFILSKLP